MEILQKAYELGKKKLEVNMKNMNGVPYELRASTTGNYYNDEKASDLYHMYNWMTSFTTGLAPLIYREDKTDEYLKWANQFQVHYHSKIFDTPLESMHDLGFLYSPYSVAMYQLTGDRHHKDDALRAADELAKRFDLRGHYIDAWGKMDDDTREGRAIIDCMMNLALLLWAWKETGNTYYRDVAVLHADTTKKYFIREDLSVAHSFNFDRKTGEMTKEDNNCGYSNGSYWARGTAWAIYGFAIIARYTENDEYRQIAIDVAKKYIESMKKDTYVPVWDFKLPKDLPAKFCGKGNDMTTWDETDPANCEFNVDSSATAITACGLLELYQQTNEEWMFDFAKDSLKALCDDKYLNHDEKVPGILCRQNGQMTYTTFGDFYFMEGLQRILFNTKSCW